MLHVKILFDWRGPCRAAEDAGLREIGVSPAAWYEAMSMELLRRRLHGRRRGVDDCQMFSVKFSSGARARTDPIVAYLPKTNRTASAGIGRPPRRRTAVPGRTALSRIAIGCPFRSNLTAWIGE